MKEILPCLGMLVALSQPLQARPLSPALEIECKKDISFILNIGTLHKTRKELLARSNIQLPSYALYLGWPSLRDRSYFVCVEEGVRVESKGTLQFRRAYEEGKDFYAIELK